MRSRNLGILTFCTIFIGLGTPTVLAQFERCNMALHFVEPCKAHVGTVRESFYQRICIPLDGLVDTGGIPLAPDLTDDDADGLPDNDGVLVCQLVASNFDAAFVMSRLDIDGDGVPDNAQDTDGDGLPDNWELGGLETTDLDGDGRVDDRVVFFPGPSPVIPGTPPTPIFTRRQVATNAFNADSDGDGLSDFIEVFGLMFIDDSKNGVLDPEEWSEGINGGQPDPDNRIFPNGLPGPGERPIDQSGNITDLLGSTILLHDFDGFVFTDPTNPDTDGDGTIDGLDADPLINPRSFGLTTGIIVRFDAEGNDDVDKDGLGNGMDMGNDLLISDCAATDTTCTIPRDFEEVDNPANLPQLLGLFRGDLLGEGIIPESAIEDLLGADWDGNGLWRTTDVIEWTPVIDLSGLNAALAPPDEFFEIDGRRLYRIQTFEQIKQTLEQPGFNPYGNDSVGLGWQTVLKPPGTSPFMPDRRVWAILYAWRVPGFDIDGDGFVGVPNLTATAVGPDPAFASIALEKIAGTNTFRVSAQVLIDAPFDSGDQPFDDRIKIGSPETEEPTFNGVIEVPELLPLGEALIRLGCGGASMIMLLAMFATLTAAKFIRRRD